MRQEARIEREAEVGRIQRYHERERGSFGDTESYAFQGYEKCLAFGSDRPEELTDDYQRTGIHAGKPLKHYGVEVETEAWGVNSNDALATVYEKIIFPIFPNHLFKMQEDGSLRGGKASAEVITQPMTKAFIRNHYRDFKTMFNVYFPMFGISAVRSGNCGMHVNISTGLFGETEDTRLDNIRKLYYIVNRHYEFCCPLFNRDINNTNWCHKMEKSIMDEYIDRRTAEKIDYRNAKEIDIPSLPNCHKLCFNGSHYNAGRIEIRLVGGQKDFGCFRNTMECVFHLVDRVKTLKWSQLDDLVAIFKGCNQYVFDRLKSKCRMAGTITPEQLAEIYATIKTEDLL